jgi:hypothetical protein
MKPFVLALSALAVALPSFALAASTDAEGYPQGLFEHSPLIDTNRPAKLAQPSAQKVHKRRHRPMPEARFGEQDRTPGGERFAE